MASAKGSKKPLPKPPPKAKASPRLPADAVSVPPPPPSKWVIVQLTTAGEREKDLALLTRSVQRILGRKQDVFIPAVSQKVRDESHTMFYMDGYVFVRHDEGVPYLRLQETTYFNHVLTKPGPDRGRRIFCLLDDRDLAPMRRGMQDMKLGEYSEGQKVKIIKGNYKNLQAVISYAHDDGEHVQVYVDLSSKKILMDFPTSYLVKLD